MNDLSLLHILALNLVFIAGVVVFIFRERLGDTWTVLSAFGLGAFGAFLFVWRPSNKDRAARLEDGTLENSLRTVEKIDRKLDKIQEKEHAPHPPNNPDPHIVDFLKRRRGVDSEE